MMNSRISKRVRPLIVLFSFAVIFFVLNACVKIKPTTAIIYVKKPDGSMCSGAQVRLYGQPANITSANASQELRIDLNAVTDAEGRAYFDLSEFYDGGQTGLAILNVDMMKGSLERSGFIQIIEQEVNEEIFFLQ
ncbi:MAG: hypothetical protein ACKO7D_09385 [Bacteroidota bacterium]